MLSAATAVLALAAGGCANRQPAPNPNLAAAAAANEHTRMIEGRKDEIIRQVATCESGGFGP